MQNNTDTPTSIFDVAKYILTKCGEIPVQRLQRLCYAAQTFHIYRTGTALFPEEFHAWKTGPVCEELFDFIEDTSTNNETRYKVTADRIPDRIASDMYTPEQIASEILTPEQRKTINTILERYSCYDNNRLIMVTLNEPWDEAHDKDLKGGDDTITTESIRKYCEAEREEKEGAR